MNYFQEIIRNFAHTNLLQQKYKNLKGWVGIFGSFGGIFFTGVIGFYLLPVLGVDLDKSVPPGERSILGLLIGVVGALFFCLIGLLISISIFSYFMYAIGKFTKNEAKYYSLRSRYPKHWYQEEYRYLAGNEENKP